MKVIVQQQQLAHGVNVVFRAVTSRSTLPVLSNILIKTDEGRLRLSATNLELGISAWIGAKVSDLNSGRYQLTTPALGKTRDQVRAELEQAVRSGDMFAAGESGSKLNELQPELYPAKAAQVGKTREEVKEELAEAIHTGDLMAAGEDGRKLNEIFPGQFHQHHAGSAAADSGHRNGQDL